MPQLPLSELRVVEIGSGDALGYCGKLFSDFGAEVVKIEPSGGREGDAELPYAIEHLAPTLGQHNEEILRDLLGLTEKEIEQLRYDGIIGNVTTSKHSKAALAAE